MSEVLTTPVSIERFLKFPKQEYKEGESNYDPSLPIKAWADPNPEPDLITGLVSYMTYVDQNGTFVFRSFQLDEAFARRTNIPAPLGKLGNARVIPVPIDMSKWDAEHYKLVRSPNPLGQFIPLVVDDRAAVELSDHDMIVAIYKAVAQGK